jgi:uncharacterized caspase-like protein
MEIDTKMRQRRRLLSVGVVSSIAMGYPWLSSLALAQTESGARERTALVMGNAGYAFGKLRNPVSDARAVASALKAMDFEVNMLEDAGLSNMLDATKAFVARGQDSQVRLLFYAGHGIQARGNNYLIPVDVALIEEDKLDAQMVSVGELVDKISALKNGVNIVILDACRTGLSANVRRRAGTGTRSAPSGLAHMSAPKGKGTLIAFSTAPGSVALDNSSYVKHLVQNMNEPGLPVEQLFKRVRTSVAEETKQAQIPWETSSLMGDFCFRNGSSGGCAN